MPTLYQVERESNYPPTLPPAHLIIQTGRENTTLLTLEQEMEGIQIVLTRTMAIDAARAILARYDMQAVPRDPGSGR